MMASYQEIDTRLAVVEDKIDFLMKVSQVTVQVGGPFDLHPKQMVMPLEQLYREIKAQGGMLVNQGKGQGMVGGQSCVGAGSLPGTEVIDADFTASDEPVNPTPTPNTTDDDTHYVNSSGERIEPSFAPVQPPEQSGS